VAALPDMAKTKPEDTALLDGAFGVEISPKALSNLLATQWELPKLINFTAKKTLNSLSLNSITS
jgi:hypothetical protein